MARRRFFVDQVRNGQAEIAGESAHHLTRVLRVEEGQKFEISDHNRVWLAEVETARRDLVRFRTVEQLETGPEPPRITLYLALIKFDRFEWAVEKATELGASRIVPVDSGRSERGLFAGAHKRVDRWRRIAHEAAEQSRRLAPPEVTLPNQLPEAVADSSDHRVWLDEQAGTPPLQRAFAPRLTDSGALLIGPEGGWLDAERALFAGQGWVPGSLGPLILRAETAVCAALGVMAQMWLSAGS